MVSVKVYVEGGGSARPLKTACRRGFKTFIESAGLTGNMPTIVACGSRGDAYNDFKTALAAGQPAMLLVDAEGPMTALGPWEHLEVNDGWNRPSGATNDQCHLLVQVMESWFLADVAALQEYYGQAFRAQRLPKNLEIEKVPKQDVLNGMARATSGTPKGSYQKGRDGFGILEALDTDKVRQASVHADRFIKALV